MGFIQERIWRVTVYGFLEVKLLCEYGPGQTNYGIVPARCLYLNFDAGAFWEYVRAGIGGVTANHSAFVI